MKKQFWAILGIVILILGVSNPSFGAIPIAGSSSGIFTNPTGPSGMLAYGVGTDTFEWGDASPWPTPRSQLNFAGVAFSGNSEEAFSFGTLTYYNGTILAGTQADAVDLEVDLTFTTPAGVLQDFTYNLGLVNTANTGDPVASADIVYLPVTMPDTYFTEGGVDYTLEFLGFGAISGSGFTTVDRFHVWEARSASAELLGRVTVVPVPGAFLLGMLGLSLAGVKLRKHA